MTARGTVHLVDDDSMFRAAVATVIELAGYEARQYASAGDFLLGYQPTQAPECVLLDLQMPGPSGLELQASLRRAESPLPVILLSAFGDVPSTVRAMRNGAVDCLTKPVAREVLLPAIDAALAEHVASRQSRQRRADALRRIDMLTRRERDVLDRVVSGLRNKQIARELQIAERTVKTHRAQLMAKLQVASVAELTAVAVELGLRAATLPGAPEPGLRE